MLKQMLLGDRNARWAKWIADALATRPGHLFVAVGAGHLAGDDSLIEALKPHGLTAVRVQAPPAKKPKRRPRN
jgi:uncharacterized protein YbaP (TraB family)